MEIHTLRMCLAIFSPTSNGTMESLKSKSSAAMLNCLGAVAVIGTVIEEAIVAVVVHI